MVPAARILHAQDTPLFRADARMVEVYLTVLDQKNRYVSNLEKSRFEVLEGSAPQVVEVFETDESPFTLAVVLDTTGSMQDSMPALKSAVVKLIEQMRAEDRIAVYGFNERLELLQDFTNDKRAAMLAVRRARAAGRTALFDAVSRVAQQMGVIKGKKSVVVFTDGNDNSSVLNLTAATTRSKKTGIPIHTVAQGEALQAAKLVQNLEEISSKTGALSFKVRKNSQMEEVFGEISKDLKATYLLAYRPKPGAGEWRPIRVQVKDGKGFKVRCREGYFGD
jgi:VWFA-related protein